MPPHPSARPSKAWPRAWGVAVAICLGAAAARAQAPAKLDLGAMAQSALADLLSAPELSGLPAGSVTLTRAKLIGPAPYRWQGAPVSWQRALREDGAQTDELFSRITPARWNFQCSIVWVESSLQRRASALAARLAMEGVAPELAMRWMVAHELGHCAQAWLGATRQMPSRAGSWAQGDWELKSEGFADAFATALLREDPGWLPMVNSLISWRLRQAPEDRMHATSDSLLLARRLAASEAPGQPALDACQIGWASSVGLDAQAARSLPRCPAPTRPGP